MAPFEQAPLDRKPRNIRLYVKRVFISDSFDEELVPRWLGFIKGVVDSSDLPLNVSREILQESRIVRTIRKQLVSRSLAMLKQLAEDKDKYRTFWEAFARYLRMGVVEDQDARADLSRLLRFTSSSSGDELIGLEDYAGRMKEGQKAIYYLTTASAKTGSAAPFVERLVKKGYEILYLTDPLDEYVVMNLAKFKTGDKEVDLVDVTREELDLGDDVQDKEELDKKAKASGLLM